MTTRTPGELYVLRQIWPSLQWQVVSVERDQGEAMRHRGEPHVYDSSSQAFTVQARLNHNRGRADH